MKKSSLQRISSRIAESEPREGLRLFSVKTRLKDAVVISGSFLGGRNFSPKSNPLIAEVVVEMLDEGTVKHTGEAIRDKLESMGASITFTCKGDRVSFDVRCLKKDIVTVLTLLAEQLYNPAFNAKRLEIVRARMIGGLHALKDDTRVRAEERFLQSLYPRFHPNYQFSIDEQTKYIKKITVKDLRRHYNFPPKADQPRAENNILFVVAGDIEPVRIRGILRRVFKRTNTAKSYQIAIRHPKEITRKQSACCVPIKDKASVDIFWGQSVSLTRKHSDYYPFIIALEILGGSGLTGRLMTTVREKKGLTYGLYAYIRGLEDGNSGHWCVWGTFAPELLERGKKEIKKELNFFVRRGVTEREVKAKKGKIVGEYIISLSTTVGLANIILLNVEEGHPKEYVDTVIDQFEHTKIDDVNRVIKEYINLNSLVFTAAGSIDKKGKPHNQ